MIGVKVLYCGHQGWFPADTIELENVVIVRASGPVTMENLIRRDLDRVTHSLSDFPIAGFWSPERGVFVVPKEQFKEVE